MNKELATQGMKLKKVILLLTLSLVLFGYDKDFKENFHKTLTTQLPKMLCKPEQVFMQCYAVEKEECETFIKLTTESCYKTFEKKLSTDKTLDELGAVGNQIGQCSGALYDMMLQKAKKADLKCLKDPKWLP